MAKHKKSHDGLPVFFTVGAEEDLASLRSYLSERFYPANAAKYAIRIQERCQSLGKMPMLGASHNDIRKGLRSVGFEDRVTIAFEVHEDRVLIVGIYFGGRQAPFLLAGR